MEDRCRCASADRRARSTRPPVKRFVKVESLKYPDIEVDYSPGKPPVIHFYDGEEEVEEGERGARAAMA